MNDYIGIAAIIGATGTLVTPIIVAILARHQNRKIEEVHKATNGMSQKLQDYAEARGNAAGQAQGKAEEKANPS